MRTFVIFPRSIAEFQDASTVKIAMKRYLKAHPELQQSDIMLVQSNWIYDGRTEDREVTEIPEQGAVITEAPKKSATIGFQLMTACDPEDSKPEHKDVN